MRAKLHWVVPQRLAIMPRPRAGDWLLDEMTSFREQGVHTIVSLLTDDEVTELGLEAEKSACASAGLSFRSFPIPDRELPSSLEEARSFARELAEELTKGRAIAIHCRMGIGRSSLIASAVMVALGVAPVQALEQLAAARGLSVPDTEEQRRWILAL